MQASRQAISCWKPTKGFESLKMNMTGRAKIILLNDESGGHPVGIVSEVVVVPSAKDQEGRLAFRGPVKFKEKSNNHLHTVVLPLVDRITGALGLSEKSYEASIVNLGAAALSGLGMAVHGFSADLPVFLALLSSSLQVGLRQDMASTGHISSLDGDVAAVRGIPAKIEAALKYSGITGIVIPDLEQDGSLKVLTPGEYKAAKESLSACRGELKIHPIKDVHGALKVLMTPESVATGSLLTGFFDKTPALAPPESPTARALQFLTDGNERRFWEALEHFLLNRNHVKAKDLMQVFALHFINVCRYPENFGEHLHCLVVSLPPSTRKSDHLFPLLSADLCIKLSQNAAGPADHDDIRRLYKAAFGEGLQDFSLRFDAFSPKQPPWGEKETFEWICSAIDEDNLTEKISRPLDQARGSYIVDGVTVEDGLGFNEAVTAFYAHLFRHTGSPAGQMKKEAVCAEALDLVERAFSRRGGYRAALSEGKHASNGGMRLVFDLMTEHLKLKRKEDYVRMVFKEAMDALDWDAKVRVMRFFMDCIGPRLPADLRNLPPEQLALHWEEVVGHFVESLSKLKGLLKRL